MVTRLNICITTHTYDIPMPTDDHTPTKEIIRKEESLSSCFL